MSEAKRNLLFLSKLEDFSLRSKWQNNDFRANRRIKMKTNPSILSTKNPKAP